MTERNEQRPVARRVGVLIEELGDETVLYDPATDRFVRLNDVAYVVWTRCDGATTVAEIAASLEGGSDLGDALDVVWLAIEELAGEALLEPGITIPPPDGHGDLEGPLSRRRLLLLAGAGLALPIVAGIAAPSPADAQSLPGGPAVPVDCVVTAWSAWSPCTATCGGGTRTRTRSIVTPAANGGAPCPTSLSETQTCNDQPCPVDCVVSDWSAWSTCSAACGGGTQTRTRTVVTSPAFGGAPCPTLSESQTCNNQPCPP